MPTLLDMVRIELENLSPDQTFEPTNDIEPDREHQVGVADREVRKLYSLGMQYDKAANETALAARYLNDKTRKREAIVRVIELEAKSKILLDIFWASLKDAFGLWDKPVVGIRRGWQVVWSESGIPPILGILGDILGGGR